MRRVRQASAERSRAKRRAVEDGPLIPRRDGHVMTKDQVIRFYRDLALAVGFEGRIGGHSARVAGAMRMAFAHHTEWTIQVFGRWGSDAVLRYVREALLGKEGGTIARTTEGFPPHMGSIEEIKAYVREIVVDLQKVEYGGWQAS